VLAGGIGSRFWPLSSPRQPKQLLRLVNERPLIADTLRRLRPVIPPERLLMLTSADIAEAIHGAIPEIPVANVLAEEAPLGTAISLAWGAREIRRRAGPNAVVFVTPADLAISLLPLFHDALLLAAAVARRERSPVLLATTPSRPETGFGYILLAHDAAPRTDFQSSHATTAASTAWRARSFYEKPSQERAHQLIASGALWYTGMFIATTSVIEKQFRTHRNDLAAGFDSSEIEGSRAFLPAVQSERSISIEQALFEPSDSLWAVQSDFEWDDVGTWASLHRARDLDDAGNGVVGPGYICDSSSNVVHSEDGATVLFGVNDLLVVRLKGVTFVTTLARAGDLRPLLASLPDDLKQRAEE
jgi:mannose-1-phosphate guanylyltransferase